MIKELAQRHKLKEPRPIHEIVDEIHTKKWQSVLAAIRSGPTTQVEKPPGVGLIKTLGPQPLEQSQADQSHAPEKEPYQAAVSPEPSLPPPPSSTSPIGLSLASPLVAPKRAIPLGTPQTAVATPPPAAATSEQPIKRPLSLPKYEKSSGSKAPRAESNCTIQAQVLGPEVPLATNSIMPIDAIWRAHWQWFANMHS